jgi:hypothetical protein
MLQVAGQVAHNSNLKIDDQIFYCKGEILDDGMPVHELFADLEDGHLLLLNPQTFPLFIAKGANAKNVGDAEAWANGDIRLDVRLNHKVSRLKKMIKQKTGLALDAQNLVFQGQVRLAWLYFRMQARAARCLVNDRCLTTPRR